MPLSSFVGSLVLCVVAMANNGVLKLCRQVLYFLLGFALVPILSLVTSVIGFLLWVLNAAIIGNLILKTLSLKTGLPFGLLTIISILLTIISISLGIFLFIALYRFLFAGIEGSLHKAASNALISSEWAASGGTVAKSLRKLWIITSVCIAPISVLVAIALPKFLDVELRLAAAGNAAQARLAMIDALKDCGIKSANGVSQPRFKIAEVPNYSMDPKDGSCKGDRNGEISMYSSDKAIYPDFHIVISDPRLRRCAHQGVSTQLNGCSARTNGKWM